MIGWMHHTPRRAVMSTCGITAVLLFVGTSAHVTGLFSHGLHPYDWAPGWLNLYWSSLALFATLAAVLIDDDNMRTVERLTPQKPRTVKRLIRRVEKYGVEPGRSKYGGNVDEHTWAREYRTPCAELDCLQN
ncbi:hypothetical protein [Streptomyces sp. IGB124]|uniref:hypothetical protein n=1 Tax=Streptomyces sp. IGB124 TaxID=1519485 RepID=UPI001F2FB5FE|nr:hypothetical protein [Streptomyces sp. IGB124]